MTNIKWKMENEYISNAPPDTSSLNRGPAVRSRGIFERDLVPGTRSGDGTQTGREPHKHLAETQPAEFERLAHGDVIENVEIGAFDSDREEGEGPALLAGANDLRRSPPIVGRFAVADQENPRAVVRDSVLTISRLAVTHHLNGLLDRLPHRRVAFGGEFRRAKQVGGLKVRELFDRSESDQRNLNALGRQLVGQHLVSKSQQPGIQFIDGPDRPGRERLIQYFLDGGELLRNLLSVIHRARSVEQEHARTPRLRVVDEFGIGERYLVG